MVTTIDIAWAAGIYEGEGSPRRAVYTPEAKRTGKQNRTFRLEVIQKDPEILHRLKQKFGGAVTPKPAKANGCKTWAVYGDVARGFGMTIFCLLSRRRQRQLVKAGLFEVKHHKKLSSEHRSKIGAALRGFHAS